MDSQFSDEEHFHDAQKLSGVDERAIMEANIITHIVGQKVTSISLLRTPHPQAQQLSNQVSGLLLPTLMEQVELAITVETGITYLLRVGGVILAQDDALARDA